MVRRRPQHSEETRSPQGTERDKPDANKIGASTPFDFSGRGLTPYGGLLPVATMLEKLGFQKLVEETLTVARIPRVMPIYQFLLGWCWPYMWAFPVCITCALWRTTPCLPGS